VGFRGFEQYVRWLQNAETLLAARRAREAARATRAPVLTLPGTCAVCLTPALFTAETQPGSGIPAARTPDGRIVPDWGSELVCDCADRLNGKARALLHMVQASGVAPWTRLLLAGPPSACDARLAALAGSVAAIFGFGGAEIPEAGSFHLVVSQDYLHRAADLPAAIALVAGALMPGGRFIFTAAFDPAAQQSQPPVPPAFHLFGWDLLDHLRNAGFSDAAGYLVWSEELGYLGTNQFIFRATR
jgi:hypothetical protein